MRVGDRIDDPGDLFRLPIGSVVWMGSDDVRVRALRIADVIYEWAVLGGRRVSSAMLFYVASDVGSCWVVECVGDGTL